MFEVFVCGEPDERVGELAEEGAGDTIPETEYTGVVYRSLDGDEHVEWTGCAAFEQ